MRRHYKEERRGSKQPQQHKQPQPALIEDQSCDDGDIKNVIDFMELVVANGDCDMVRSEDSDMDGREDTALQVKPGTTVCYRIGATGINRPDGALYRGVVQVRGDDALVDTRPIIIVIPPTLD